MSAQTFIDGVVAELASTIAALTGHAATVGSGAPTTAAAWVVGLRVSGAHAGRATLTLDAPGTEVIARSVMGADADVSPGSVANLIRELVVQSVGALGRQPSFAGTTIGVETIDAATTAASGAGAFSIVFGDQQRLQVTAAVEIEGAGQMAEASLAPPTGLTTRTPASNWDVLLDIDLPLRVRFGSTEMSIRALSTLGPGSLVDMGRAPEDPVEILVCGRVIARAEVVVVDGNYGVRVTDVLSAPERVRALEGQL